MSSISVLPETIGNKWMVLERQHQMESQSAAFCDLTGNPDVFDPESREGLHQLTEVMAK